MCTVQWFGVPTIVKISSFIAKYLTVPNTLDRVGFVTGAVGQSGADIKIRRKMDILNSRWGILTLSIPYPQKKKESNSMLKHSKIEVLEIGKLEHVSLNFRQQVPKIKTCIFYFSCIFIDSKNWCTNYTLNMYLRDWFNFVV